MTGITWTEIVCVAGICDVIVLNQMPDGRVRASRLVNHKDFLIAGDEKKALRGMSRHLAKKFG